MKSTVFMSFAVLTAVGVLILGSDVCDSRSFLMNQVATYLKPSKSAAVENQTNNSAEKVSVESEVGDACIPPSAEQRNLQAKLNKKFASLVKERKEIANGFAYKFSSNDTKLDELKEFVENEQECCPFLSFKIDSESHKNEIWVVATSEEGAKEYLETFLKN